LEEVYLAVKQNKPTFLVGSFSGITKKIIELLEGAEVEELTFEYQSKHSEKLRSFLENAFNEDKKEIMSKYKEMNSFLKGKSKRNKNIFIEKSSSIDKIISSMLNIV
jgi:hypothetical protein